MGHFSAGETLFLEEIKCIYINMYTVSVVIILKYLQTVCELKSDTYSPYILQSSCSFILKIGSFLYKNIVDKTFIFIFFFLFLSVSDHQSLSHHHLTVSVV